MSVQFQQWLMAAVTNLAFCVVSGILAGVGDYSTIHHDWHSALVVGILTAASAALTLFGKSYIKMAQTVASLRESK